MNFTRRTLSSSPSGFFRRNARDARDVFHATLLPNSPYNYRREVTTSETVELPQHLPVCPSMATFCTIRPGGVGDVAVP